MNSTKFDSCPVCLTDSARVEGMMINHSLMLHFTCRRCGTYQIDDVTKGYLKSLLTSEKEIIVLSHAIKKSQTENYIPTFNLESIKKILQNPLPSPTDQINNFILWLGNNAPLLGETIDIHIPILQTEIAVATPDGLRSIIKYLLDKELVEGKQWAGTLDNAPGFKLALTLDGWKRHEDLKTGKATNRRAFMAMQYGDQELDNIIVNCFRPAVKLAGFDLFRLDDLPKAGLIDDRLRVEIRTSRFLIADLTHENRGAYWEAGYAEGLGKPVIYTCEKGKFTDRTTHFDTNHHTTVLWDKNCLEEAAHNLKNTIRATLPEEAKLTDDT